MFGQIMKVTFVTGNKNKLAEVVKIIGDSLQLDSKDVDIVEIQGTAEEITIHKCLEAAKVVNGPVIIEDTGLCFNALNGLPGPYVKWFLKEIGPAGLHKMLNGFEDKTGYAICTMGYCEGPEHEPILFKGITNGTIVEPRGPQNFGWDPVFQPEGYNQTYAEMSAETKNSCSHRYKSIKLLQEYLSSKVENKV
ncbi:hypothetical protein BB559_002553 [Furculomyces boomerangus]|uniref:Inosine triphosphate pyrophosphatase n=1 Tax=Furculomyces boomerangus TaxID=61424 RepID=A0A2T9YUH6_9FUNG|nr:hypothetical protein BB559_002553 [Furculomyces boomerangus]